MVTFHPGARPGSDGSTVSKTSLCVSDTPRSGLHVGTGPILTSENNSKTKQHSSCHDSKHLRIPINNATPSFPARHVPFDNRHTQAQAFCLKLAGGIHTNRPRFWGPLQPLSFFCGDTSQPAIHTEISHTRTTLCLFQGGQHSLLLNQHPRTVLAFCAHVHGILPLQIRPHHGIRVAPPGLHPLHLSHSPQQSRPRNANAALISSSRRVDVLPWGDLDGDLDGRA